MRPATLAEAAVSQSPDTLSEAAASALKAVPFDSLCRARRCPAIQVSPLVRLVSDTLGFFDAEKQPIAGRLTLASPQRIGTRGVAIVEPDTTGPQHTTWVYLGALARSSPDSPSDSTVHFIIEIIRPDGYGWVNDLWLLRQGSQWLVVRRRVYED
ncbi:MAG: hypothetical protein HY700_05215 [Gemmatimonadetes bacterium]|nr:hypothetical protein [Gemmatimonadota bacterium]